METLLVHRKEDAISYLEDQEIEITLIRRVLNEITQNKTIL